MRMDSHDIFRIARAWCKEANWIASGQILCHALQTRHGGGWHYRITTIYLQYLLWYSCYIKVWLRRLWLHGYLYVKIHVNWKEISPLASIWIKAPPSANQKPCKKMLVNKEFNLDLCINPGSGFRFQVQMEHIASPRKPASRWIRYNLFPYDK